MRNIKLTIEYDGTDFHGFQRQKNHRSVQAELEKTLSKILKEKVHVKGSGRTDAGVHAEAQVVNFKTTRNIPAENLKRALNSSLPRDIAVKGSEEVSGKFHSRFSAKSKIYRYRVLSSRTPSPLAERYAFRYVFPLNVSKMREAAKYIKGKKDFCSFQCKADGKNSVKTLKKLSIVKKGDVIDFTLQGDGFLYNMVRNIVGTLLDVGRGRILPSEVKKILSKKDRRKAGETVPPQGLTLVKVKY